MWVLKSRIATFGIESSDHPLEFRALKRFIVMAEEVENRAYLRKQYLTPQPTISEEPWPDTRVKQLHLASAPMNKNQVILVKWVLPSLNLSNSVAITRQLTQTRLLI